MRCPSATARAAARGRRGRSGWRAGGVVEQVVEQDLAGQHRQERQHRRGRGRAEHVAEVARGAHQHVLDGVGEDPPALGDAVGEHAEVLLQQHDVGGVLGDVGGGVDRDADVGVVQRQRVVDPVAEEADRRARCARSSDQPGLLLRVRPGRRSCRPAPPRPARRRRARRSPRR